MIYTKIYSICMNLRYIFCGLKLWFKVPRKRIESLVKYLISWLHVDSNKKKAANQKAGTTLTTLSHYISAVWKIPGWQLNRTIIVCYTRMHYSRMLTVCCSGRIGGGGKRCLPGRCLPRGVFAWGCLPKEGVCLGGCLPRRGCLPRGCLSGGCLPPLVNRMTDRQV